MEYKSPAVHRTPLYRAKAAYRGMTERCLNANGKHAAYANVELRLTKEEWLEWAMPFYTAFLLEDPDGRPSVSRFGDTGHYEIGNIEIISIEENRRRQKRSRQVTNGHKECSKCKVTFPVSGFHKNKKKPDGISYWCKVCIAKVNKGRKRSGGQYKYVPVA